MSHTLSPALVGTPAGPARPVAVSFGPSPLAVAYLTGEVSSLVALCWEALSSVDPVRLGGWVEAREVSYRDAAVDMAAHVAGGTAVRIALDEALQAAFPGRPVPGGRRRRAAAWVAFELASGSA